MDYDGLSVVTWRGYHIRGLEKREREYERERRAQEAMRQIAGGNPPPRRYTKADRLQEENDSLRKHIQELQQKANIKEQDIDVMDPKQWDFARALNRGIRAFIRFATEAVEEEDISSARFRLLELS